MTNNGHPPAATNAKPPLSPGGVEVRQHWTDPDWTASPEIAALTDAELLAAARAAIRSHAGEIAEIVNLKTNAVEAGLYGYRWPKRSLDANALSDVLTEASIILQSVRLGMSLETAAGSMVMAHGMKVHGGRLPRTEPPRNTDR